MITTVNARLGRLKRILVALDASEQSLTALETAATLAQAMQGELTGLFVEDAELLTLKALNAFERADVVLHDRLISAEVLELAGKT